MKEQSKHIFKLLLILIMFSIPMCISPIVKADSGWDSDYGGSYDYDYDYDYDYSYDNDYNYNNNYDYNDSYYSPSSTPQVSYGYSDSVAKMLMYAFIMLVVLLIVISPKSMHIPPDNENKYVRYGHVDIPLDRLQKILPNQQLETLKEEMYYNFIAIQNAWMNFEYNNLRDLCTDELYNTYKAQLETLKLKNGQNIMNSFNYIDSKIINIEEINDEIVLTVFLCVEFYDYVINITNKKVTRGNNSKPVLNNYIMTFIKEKDSKKKTRKCPNCGATIQHITSSECEYCNSTIVTKPAKFVLSSKKSVNR